MKKLLLSLLLFSLYSHVYAQTNEFQKEFGISIGMANISYTETQSGLAGENIKQPASGSTSNMSLLAFYKFLPGLKRSAYLYSTLPAMSSGQSTYFSVGAGMEFYFNEIGSRMSMSNSGTTIRVTPRLRYFWGFEGGVGYISYLTLTEKRTDFLMDLGLMGGGTYPINDKWALRMQLTIARGTGINTTAMEMKAFLGGTFYLDN
jgi:hypothetical protein